MNIEQPTYAEEHEKNEQVQFIWTKPRIDLKWRFNDKKGPFIEVGGPSGYEDQEPYRGYEFIGDALKENKDRFFISNITKYQESHDGHPEPVDFQADGAKLPFADRSVGALFAKSMNLDVREGILREAARILESGGLLVWNGTRFEDFCLCKNSPLSYCRPSGSFRKKQYGLFRLIVRLRM